MALRKSYSRAFTKLFLLVLFAVSCVLFLHWSLPKLSWHMRYGETLNSHKARVDSFLSAGRIDALSLDFSLDKWQVCSRASFGEYSSEYVVILKYCRPSPQEDNERIVAWVGWTSGNLMVQRYLLVYRQNCLQNKMDAAIRIKVPTTVEEFDLAVESLGFEKCCHASLLDLEKRRNGIAWYNVTSTFLYEAQLGGEIWLYWETDYEGNILARGAHDSP